MIETEAEQPTDFREYIRRTVQVALQTVKERQGVPDGTIVIPAGADLNSFNPDPEYTRAQRTLERWGGAVDSSGRLINPAKAKEAFAAEIAELQTRIQSEQQTAEQDHAAALLQEEIDFSTNELAKIAAQKEITSGVATRVYSRALSEAKTEFATTQRARAEAKIPFMQKDLAYSEKLAAQIPDAADVAPQPVAS